MAADTPEEPRTPEREDASGQQVGRYELLDPAAGRRPMPLDHLSPQSLEDVEAHFIAKTLRENHGNRAATAAVLGIDKSTLWRKIKRHKLD